MKYVFIIIALYLNIGISAGQETRLPINKLSHKFIIGLDGRKSFIGKQHVGIAGIRIGIQHYDKFRIGIGYYFLTNSNRSGILPSPFPARPHTDVKFKFHYFAGFFEYIIHRSKHWEFTIPLILGVGNIKHQLSDENSNIENAQKTVMLVEPSITATYKIFKWIGIGVGVGGRKMIFANELIRKNFDSPIYIARLRIYVAEIVKEGREKIKDK